MGFLYWLYVLARLWFAYRRGRRPVSAAEYVKTLDADPFLTET